LRRLRAVDRALVGIDLARAHGRWGVTSPALSIARWGHISTVATFHEAPLRSRTAGFPGSGSGLGPARHLSGSGLLPSRWSLSGDTHPLHSGEICSRPRPNARAALTQLCVWGHTSKSRPPSTQSPFARRLVGASSRNAWESVTSPSSLIMDSCARPCSSRCLGLPRPPDLCRLLSLPAGTWPFPTLSLHPLRRRLDPYPAVSLRCTHPFLPRGHRPRTTGNVLGRRNYLCNATSAESRIFGAAAIRFASSSHAR